MASFNTTTVLRVGAPLPTSAGAATMEGDLISGMEEKHEFIVQDGDQYVCKTTLFVDAVGFRMDFETAMSSIKVEPADDGGTVVKLECSYKLMPVPSVDVENKTAETHEVGGAPNFKLKLD